MAADFADTVTNLKAEMDNISAELLTISAHPKPFYIVNQQPMSATDYRRFLRDQIDGIHEQIMKLQGPYRVTTFKRPV